MANSIGIPIENSQEDGNQHSSEIPLISSPTSRQSLFLVLGTYRGALHLFSLWFQIFPINSRQTARLWREGVVGVWKGHLTLSRAPTFFCGFCSYTSTRSDSMVRHVRSHTGEKPFQCRLCGRAFRQHAHMRSHMVGVHGALWWFLSRQWQPWPSKRCLNN
jgi:uncharacterized Zn-finger protein